MIPGVELSALSAHDLDQLKTQMVLAWAVPTVMEFLKKRGFFPTANDMDRLYRWISWIMAVLATAGVQFTFTGSMVEGGTILIAYPSIHSLLDFVGNVVIQRMGQELGYQKLVKPLAKTAAKK